MTLDQTLAAGTQELIATNLNKTAVTLENMSSPHLTHFVMRSKVMLKITDVRSGFAGKHSNTGPVPGRFSCDLND